MKKYDQAISTIDEKLSSESISNFINILRLQITKFLKSWSTYILLIIFPLLMTLSAITIVPATWALTIIVAGSLMLSTFYIFGFYYINVYKNSYFSILKIKNKNYLLIISTFILILFSNILFVSISIIYVFSFSFLFETLSIYDLNFSNVSSSLTFINARWIPFFYYLILETIILFLLALLFFNFTKNKNRYIFFVGVYMITSLFFGGLLYTYYYDAFKLFANSEINSQYITYNAVEETIYLSPSLESSQNFTPNIATIVPHLFPTFQLSQFARNTFSYYEIIESVNIGTQLAPVGTQIQIKYFNIDSLSWIFIIVLPYVWIMILTISNISLTFYKKQG